MKIVSFKNDCEYNKSRKEMCSYMFSTFFLIVLILASCNAGKDHNITLPSKSVNLIGEPINIELVGVPYIKQLGDILLVQNVKDTSGIFQVYETQNFQALSKFGMLGNGPNEFEQPIWSAQIVGSNQNKKMFGVHDLTANSVTTIDIKNSALKYEILYDEQQLLQNPLDRIQKVVLNNDTLLIFQPYSIGRLVIYRKDKKTNEVVPFQADTKYEINDDLKWRYFDGHYAVNVDLSLVFSATAMLGQVDFYSISGQPVKRIIYDNYNHQSKSVTLNTTQNGDIIQYAVDVEASADFIYVLVQDWPLSQFRSNTFTDKARVLKFDWEGNFLIEYHLDHFATSFAIDEIRSRIYTYNFFTEENDFYSYEID